MIKAQDLAAPGQEVPQRAYECPGCSLWHLTHLERWRAATEEKEETR
ncbi:hypothetical protein [Rubrobacter marinus]|nr:hypothetical protein [Rubrobacter marinus]